MTGYTFYREYSGGNNRHNVFLCSDLHLDAKGCDVDLLKSELSRAVELKADIIIGGDVFDAILHGDRKRYTPGGDKFGSDTNLNKMVKHAADFLRPYTKNIIAIGHGNHEMSVVKYHNFDPVDALIYDLSREDGVEIKPLHYTGIIRYIFKAPNSRRTRTYKIYYNHGQGASAEISKGLIMVDRHRKKVQADMYWFGHTHTKVVLPAEHVIFMNNQGTLEEKQIKCLITGCYNKVFYDSTGKDVSVNYGEERMRTNQATGGALVTFINSASTDVPMGIEILI
jgi:predicted phosphodiesterase